jgi:hypothetical protein
MSVEKRGKYYYMYFVQESFRVQKSTKCTNKLDALDIEHAYRTQLAKREVGLEVKKPIPLFRDALRTFLEWSKASIWQSLTPIAELKRR